VALENSVSIEKNGSVIQKPLSRAERNRVLIEGVGINEEIVAQLPDDVPTPPPPWSRTAQALAGDES
jgi:hypothetical protein